VAYSFLCDLTAVPLGAARQFTLPDKEEVVVFHTSRGYFATAAWCPHAGGILLEGQVKKGTLKCLWHGWKYRLSDGVCLNQKGKRLRVYDLKIEDGRLFIQWDSPDRSARGDAAVNG